MKNKKGFTLIEIIVSLTLIALIVTISIVSISKNNNIDKKRKKIISDVTNAANVYYSNNKEFQKEVYDNYGYKVISVKTLQDQGYLVDNIIDPKENKNINEVTEGDKDTENFKDYSKVVVVQSRFNSENSTDKEDSDLGVINIIYPYENATSDSIYALANNIFFEWREPSTCDSVSLNGFNNILLKLNKDYTVTSTKASCESEYKEKLEELSKHSKKTENTAFNAELCSGIKGECDYKNNTLTLDVKYNMNEDSDKNIGTRTFYYYDKYSPNLEIEIDDQNSKEFNTLEEKNSKWYNKNIQFKYNVPADNRKIDIKFYAYLITDERGEPLGEFSDLNQLNDGSYYIEYDFSAYPINAIKKVGTNELYSESVRKQINIDRIAPFINQENKKIIITDETSGIQSIVIKDKNNNSNVEQFNYTEKTTEEEIELDINKTYTVTATDNAGNTKDIDIDTKIKYPFVKITPVENSFDQYNLNITYDKDEYLIKSITYKAKLCETENSDVKYTYNSNCEKGLDIEKTFTIENNNIKSSYNFRLIKDEGKENEPILTNIVNEINNNIFKFCKSGEICKAIYDDDERLAKKEKYLYNLLLKYDIIVQYAEKSNTEKIKTVEYNFKLTNDFKLMSKLNVSSSDNTKNAEISAEDKSYFASDTRGKSCIIDMTYNGKLLVYNTQQTTQRGEGYTQKLYTISVGKKNNELNLYKGDTFLENQHSGSDGAHPVYSQFVFINGKRLNLKGVKDPNVKGKNIGAQPLKLSISNNVYDVNEDKFYVPFTMDKYCDSSDNNTKSVISGCTTYVAPIPRSDSLKNIFSDADSFNNARNTDYRSYSPNQINSELLEPVQNYVELLKYKESITGFYPYSTCFKGNSFTSEDIYANRLKNCSDEKNLLKYTFNLENDDKYNYSYYITKTFVGRYYGSSIVLIRYSPTPSVIEN